MRTGKLEEGALKRSVLGALYPNPSQRQQKYGADCAVFETGSVQAAASASSVPGFEGRPEWSLLSAANHLYAGGFAPRYYLLQAAFPADWEEKEIREKMQNLAEEAKKRSIAAAGGHTQICRELASPWYAVTCLGEKNGAEALRPEAGWDLVVTRQIALAGTAALAQKGEEELNRTFPSSMIGRASAFSQWMLVKQEAETAARMGDCRMRDLSQGGIFAALWEFAQRWELGLEVDLKKIPICQETVEICEYFDLNPYCLYSGGSLLIGTPKGDALVEALREKGIPAVQIGRLTGEKARRIYNGEECRYLDRPAQDEWYRFEDRRSSK